METAVQAGEYAAVVFDPNDLVELRALRGRMETATEFCRAKDLGSKGILAWIEKHRAEQYNVYIGANPRKRNGRKAEDVALARCLFADMDGIEASAAESIIATAGLIAPSLIVATGHGAHAYWRLTEPITDLSLWTRYQKAIIAKLESDGVVHDAPRIMRLPGTTNWKDDPPVGCHVAGGTRKPVVLSDLGVKPAEPRSDGGGGPSLIGAAMDGEDWRGKLSRNTLLFAMHGAKEGERNGKLFAAACDCMGNGAPLGDCMAYLSPPAMKAGLEPDEIEHTIRSAYGRQREPSVKPKAFSAWDKGPTGDAAPTDPSTGISTQNAGEPAQLVKEKAIAATRRPVISNVAQSTHADEDGKRKVRVWYKPVTQIAAELAESVPGWPARVSGLLFVVNPSDEPLPGFGCVWTLDSADSFGAWLHSVADVHWSSGKKEASNADGRSLTAVTKREVFEYLKATAKPAFRAISPLPHEPVMKGVYYLPCALPPSTGAALAEFISLFNPETELDRQLILAALITPGWGGGAGERPPFLISSEHGRGAGKTSTVQAITHNVWGGAISMTPGEDFDGFKKRLLGNEGLSNRCVVADNIKGRYEGQGIESIVTEKTIDGWRPYHGQYSRPNDMTYYITANHPSMSKDMASRAVVIKIGAPKHAVLFKKRVDELCDGEGRARILSDIFALLASPPRGCVPDRLRSRWAAWEDGVLSRVGDPESLAALIQERRGEIDQDEDEGSEVAEAIQAWVRKQGLSDLPVVEISRDQMRALLIEARVVDESMGKRGIHTWVGQMLGSQGALARLRDGGPNKSGGPRKWLWMRDDSSLTNEQGVEIPV